ncbi:MAG TPA: glycosyltransferase family 2 protein [Pyrinomonadaceae bacterium]|nr:glycosyltransferase family 2 protein [Pyrinomonadaceae bacterium]
MSSAAVRSSPLVTIAIPTFDRFEYLKEAVTSALAQTYEPIEVLIGDDGTSESINRWARELSQSDRRVRYQRNATNLGLAANWNALADAARGDLLIIIGDDDRLLPDFVKKLVFLIVPFGQVAFANHYLINAEGKRLKAESIELTKRYHRQDLVAGEQASPAICVWQNAVPMSAALIRTDDVRRLRFKEDLNTPEIEFFARLAGEDAKFFFTPDYLSEYRVHSQSATSSGLRGERLVKYLTPIPVSAEVEPFKRNFMADLLVQSVTNSLQAGDGERAREFLQHEYYPRTAKTSAISLAQNLCTRLPSSLGSPAYRILRATKSRLLGA